MFGESESESPRVPSPWDSLISGPPSPVPSLKSRTHTPSPLAVELIPRLVPEADDGNVEYKLQLLNPSPARFARLVTQMKWRLLEGGGQAYYELGVADSGDLIGLPREELEQSLETLEMMAGEIGASVIVVKEIEVPAIMATLAKRNGNTEWPGGGGKRLCRDGTPSSLDNGYSTGTTETETENDSLCSTEDDDLSMTVVLERASPTQHDSVFSMDPENQEAADGNALSTPSIPQTRFLVDLEISSVFKPRPMRARMHNHPHYAHSTGGKAKRVKKYKHLNMLASTTQATVDANTHEDKAKDKDAKSFNRRQARDRRREEKRKALEDRVTATITTTHAVITDVSESYESTLIPALEALHVGIVEEPARMDPSAHSQLITQIDMTTVEDFADDDDVFPSLKTAMTSFPTFSAASKGESHLDVDIGIVGALGGGESVDGKRDNEQTRLIVEALVVRKMSLEEAFLDFGGFSLT